ncbi:related to WD40-repeat protein (notchless protein) [Phialocephala subalpina]|uniref:Mitochondrial division protein 1 n=1 Tax=Phialocephala subalpina TaxID=576137 RepID=A0A1L7XCS6_9HELO|nr:related to WD40-repeat protein (notchless protein) [Phialocephala subalpina]
MSSRAISKNTFGDNARIHQGDIINKFSQKLLPIAEYATFDSYPEGQNARCHPDTRQDLLCQIKEWAGDPHGKCLYWLNGMAGTGKSTIARTIAQWFKDQGFLGASFFFKRGEQDRSNARLFFTTIAYQFVSWERTLEPYIRDSLDADPALTTRQGIKEQFKKLVFEPLECVRNNPQNPANIVIVVDALDECDGVDDVRTIIHLLSQLKALSSVRMKVFITSRPERPIRLGFKDIRDTYQDTVLHQIPEPIIERDISVFLKSEFVRIRDDYNSDNVSEDLHLPSSWPGEDLIQILVHIATPLFIFATTICRFVEDPAWLDPASQLEKALDYQTSARDSELDRLDAMYLPILNQLIIGSTGLKRSRLVNQFRDIIGPIVLLAEPLSISSLATLLDIPISAIIGRLNSLHSVLEVPSKTDSPIRLFHLSFRDFLVDPAKSTTNEFWVDETKCHERLAKRCLELMSSGYLKRDICKLKMPGKIRTEVAAETINACLPAHVQYACLYWVRHLKESGGIMNDGDQAHSFLEHHFLHWLEALSLLGRLSESIGIVDHLLVIVAAGTSTKVSRFLHDAKRFILSYYSIADSSPLQLYCSALIFAPKASIIRNTFRNYIPSWISQQPEVEFGWNAVQQTLEGHSSSVYSVAFSHDSKLLASASNDKTIKIWDTNTGSLQQTLKGHSDWFNNSIAFSHDSKLLALASNDKTIKIWDTNTGSLQQTLKGHKDGINSVAFSHDSKLLASASNDKTVKIWDTSTSSCRQTLRGYSGMVYSIAFSQNSKLLASYDGTVKIWDTSTGSLQQTLKGYNSIVKSVAFSHDSKLLALASFDKTVKIWDTSTGSFQQTLKGYSDMVYSMAFSQNSKLLALASLDKTVKIWDTSTGSLQQTLKGHSNWVNSVAFSHNSKLLASASDDGTVKIWDTSINSRQQTVEGHSDSVNSITFSHDSKLLASASDDGTVKIWDTSTSSLQQTLKGHSSLVNFVAFSYNSKLLASASGDRTVKVWDTSAGSCHQTITVNTKVTSLSFDSTNSNLLMNGSNIKVDRTGLLSRSEHPQEGRDEGGCQRLGISRSWVTWNTQNLLWLPPDYRAKEFDISPSGSIVAGGCSTGRVFIIGFLLANLIQYFE